MKTILVLTDFSDHAKHAAEYALKLVQKIKADLLLCNTFTVPAEMSMAGISVWPQEEYTVLSEGSSAGLKLLKKNLQGQADASQDVSGFHPNIAINSAVGNISGLVQGMFPGTDVQLVVAGTHDKSVFNDFLLGNNVNTIIDDIDFPLLLVPPTAAYKPIKKIAFATDLVDVGRDEKALYRLINLARPLNAEILVTHIYNEDNSNLEFEKQIKTLLTVISNKADYAHIYSRVVDEENPEKGLIWLCENGQVDILTMTHQHHHYFEKLFTASYTHKMAKQIGIPLLVMPN